jgi:hypothetical protein
MLKIVTMACALALAAQPVLAQTAVSGSSSNSTSGSSSQSGAGAQSIVISKGSKIPRGVGAAVAPGLTAGGLTCQGSASAAVGGQGFGIAFGMTRMDRDCNSRENAKTIYLMGFRGAGTETMCDIPQVRAAMARAGTPCAADRARVVSNTSSGAGPAVVRDTRKRVTRAQVPTFTSMSACREYAQTHAVTCVVRKKKG